ncbi:MAG: VIT1/CCC1 transporter family protein [Deltaproteobacteria bacterium]|nr:VIT1/CCC1 transporter family protein [Deltaproteobacteria bacterium]
MRARWRAERESAWLYETVAACEPDAARQRAFVALGRSAMEQAAILAGDLGETPAYRPSLRARLVAAAVRRWGPERVQPLLRAIKVRGMAMYLPPSPGHVMPTSTEGLGKRHKRGGGNLRAAVFGINDGLLSNTSLILGVAGAGAEARSVLLTGIAGLLSGAFSMASGEWVSMNAQREMFEHQIEEEGAELDRYPEEEAEELARVYEGRGIPLEEARAITTKLARNRDQMLATLAREELGLNPDDLGSPWGAAASSFASFAVGALVPLAPFALGAGRLALPIAAAAAGVCLLAVGATLSLFSGKSAIKGGLRMLAIGAAAGGATWGIGQLIGVSLA